MTTALAHRRFSRRMIALVFAIAVVSDALSMFLALAPPVQWVVDLVTAALLFIVLGWQWVLLPGLIAEAIPGVYVFPFWVLVAASIFAWGKTRPKRNDQPSV